MQELTILLLPEFEAFRQEASSTQIPIRDLVSELYRARLADRLENLEEGSRLIFPECLKNGNLGEVSEFLSNSFPLQFIHMLSPPRLGESLRPCPWAIEEPYVNNLPIQRAIPSGSQRS